MPDQREEHGPETLADVIPTPADASPTDDEKKGTPDGTKDAPGLGATREKLAFRLLWILAGVIIVIMLVSLAYSINCWRDDTTCTAANDALSILTAHTTPIFTAMIGLVGSVVGFYFGSKQN